MDRLPWHLQLEVYKRIDMDTRRALNVTPGKICLPGALRAALERSMARRMYIRRAVDWSHADNWVAMVTIPIAGTGRKYHLFSR